MCFMLRVYVFVCVLYMSKSICVTAQTIMLLLSSNSVHVVKFFIYDITFFTMSLTNDNVVQIYKIHNGSINAVYKEICEALQTNSSQVNKSIKKL